MGDDNETPTDDDKELDGKRVNQNQSAEEAELELAKARKIKQ